MPLIRGESPLFVLFCVNLVHCGNWWVGVERRTLLARSHRYNRVTGLLCLDGFLFTQHRACLRLSSEDPADLETLSWEKKAENNQQSILHLPEPSSQCILLVLWFLCLARADMAGVPDNEWELRWEA